MWKQFAKPLKTIIKWSVGGFALLLFLLILIILLFPASTLGWLATNWEVEHPLESADAIFVPGGGGHFRPQHAAKLWNQGYAPTVLVPRPAETAASGKEGVISEQQIDKETLRRLEVAESAIEALPTEVSSTADEIRVLREWIQENDAKIIIVATDRFHSRRFHWLATREIERPTGTRCLVSISPWQHTETDSWWKNPWGREMFARELFKHCYYLVFRR